MVAKTMFVHRELCCLSIPPLRDVPAASLGLTHEVVTRGCPTAPYARNGCRYAMFAPVYDNHFVRKVLPPAAR
jgi:hypothetical protein